MEVAKRMALNCYLWNLIYKTKVKLQTVKMADNTIGGGGSGGDYDYGLNLGIK